MNVGIKKILLIFHISRNTFIYFFFNGETSLLVLTNHISVYVTDLIHILGIYIFVVQTVFSYTSLPTHSYIYQKTSIVIFLHILSLTSSLQPCKYQFQLHLEHCYIYMLVARQSLPLE